MVGSVPHKQGEYRECSMCWQKQAVRPEGEPLSLPLLSPVRSLLLNYLQGQTGVGSLCILEGTSWRWDRKFCNLRSNRISPNHSGVRKASFTSSFSKITIWFHPLLWHQSKVVTDNILLFGETTDTTKVKLSLWNESGVNWNNESRKAGWCSQFNVELFPLWLPTGNITAFKPRIDWHWKQFNLLE